MMLLLNGLVQDWSDEGDCQTILFPESYDKHTAPYTVDSYGNIIKTTLNISIEIIDITRNIQRLC